MGRFLHVFVLLVMILRECEASPRLSLPNTKNTGEEAVGVGGEAVNIGWAAAGDILATTEGAGYKPQCSLLFITHSYISPNDLTKMVTQVGGTRGNAVLNMADGDDLRNNTKNHMASLINLAKQGIRAWWCVMVVLISDDPVFVATWVSMAHTNGLLDWPTRVLAITTQSIHKLTSLQEPFSRTNSLTLSCTMQYQCDMFSYVPYSDPQTQVKQVAKWTPSRGLSLTSKLPLFHQKFHTFVERPTLVVAAEEFQPHVQVINVKGGQSFNMQGPMASLLTILAQSVNFSYTFLRPPDGAWGVKRKDGSWTGMVGMVGRDEADLGLGPFAVTTVRAEMIDYTRPILIDYARILAGRGQPEVDPWGFLLPFTPAVWGAMLVALLLVLLTVLLMAIFALPDDTGLYWFSDTASHYIRVLLQQDLLTHKLRWWRRLVLGGWMVLILVLTRSYSSTLMSLLAVRYIPQPFQTLRELLDHPDATMIWEVGSMYNQFLTNVESGVFSEVRKAGEYGRLVYVKSTEYGPVLDQRVRPGTHVFIFEDLTGRVLRASDFSSTGRCDFYSSKEEFLPYMFGMIGQKHSPLVPALNARVRAVTEAGLYGHWLDATVPNSTSCLRPVTKITVQASLSLNNLWGVFAVLGGGLVVSAVVLCVEVIIAIKNL